MFGRRFKKLINSDKYKNSNYVVQKVNGFYVLKIKDSNNYVDLYQPHFSWPFSSRFFSNCQSRFKWRVIKAFNYRVPVIKKITSIIEY